MIAIDISCRKFLYLVFGYIVRWVIHRAILISRLTERNVRLRRLCKSQNFNERKFVLKEKSWDERLFSLKIYPGDEEKRNFF